MTRQAEFYRVTGVQQQRKAKTTKRWVLAFLGVVIVIGGLLLSTQIASFSEHQRPSAASMASTASTVSAGVAKINHVHPGTPVPLLVNKTNPLLASATSSTIVDLVGIVPVKDNTMQVDKNLVNPLRDLFAGARQSGLSDFYVNSAYRTQQMQKAIYQGSPDKAYAQKPGHSEHQTGLAVDLAVTELSGDNMGQSTSGQWLAAHSWEYGFILRYPAGKEAITGIAYEPWHFRYVGRQIAQYCYEHKLCLEEYVAKANGN